MVNKSVKVGETASLRAREDTFCRKEKRETELVQQVNEDVFKVNMAAESYTSLFYSLYRQLDAAGTERNILDVAFVLITQT